MRRTLHTIEWALTMTAVGATRLLLGDAQALRLHKRLAPSDPPRYTPPTTDKAN